MCVCVGGGGGGGGRGHNVFALSICLLFTIITQSIGILLPYLLTILVLKFVIVHYTTS